MLKKSALAVLVIVGMVLSSGVARADLTLMKSKYEVTFYGYIKAEAIYHSHQALGDNWAVYAFPDMEPFKSHDTLSFTARQSRFGFNIKAPGPTEDSSVLGKFEMDFYGKGHTENKPALMLRRAYVMLKNPNWSLLAGNEWMLMSPLYPHTSNYPAGAGIGNLGYRMPQVRLTFGNKIRFAVSAGEKIESDLTTKDFDAGDNSAVPDMQGQLGYWGDKLTFVLSGHYAEEQYAEKGADGDFHDVTFESWSYNASLNVKIGKRLALRGEGFYGVNLDGWYTGSVFNQGVGIDEDGERTPVRDVGGYVELMVKPHDRVTFFGGYGEDNPEDDDIVGGPWENNPDNADTLAKLIPVDGGITKNQMYYGHVFFDVTKSMRVSAEVMKIRTEYKNDGIHDNDGELWRSDLAFWFFF